MLSTLKCKLVESREQQTFYFFSSKLDLLISRNLLFHDQDISWTFFATPQSSLYTKPMRKYFIDYESLKGPIWKAFESKLYVARLRLLAIF